MHIYSVLDGQQFLASTWVWAMIRLIMSNILKKFTVLLSTFWFITTYVEKINSCKMSQFQVSNFTWQTSFWKTTCIIATIVIEPTQRQKRYIVKFVSDNLIKTKPSRELCPPFMLLSCNELTCIHSHKLR